MSLLRQNPSERSLGLYSTSTHVLRVSVPLPPPPTHPSSLAQVSRLGFNLSTCSIALFKTVVHILCWVSLETVCTHREVLRTWLKARLEVFLLVGYVSFKVQMYRDTRGSMEYIIQFKYLYITYIN